MRNAVIVGYKRSPFTFARKGEMANIRPEDILSQTINQLLNDCLLYTSPSPRDGW